MSNVDNLQAYLKQVGVPQLRGPELKAAKTAEYLVLYSSREKLDTFIVAHPVDDLYTAECMVRWEVYAKARVVKLSDSSVVIEEQRYCPCHNPRKE